MYDLKTPEAEEDLEHTLSQLPEKNAPEAPPAARRENILLTREGTRGENSQTVRDMMANPIIKSYALPSEGATERESR